MDQPTETKDDAGYEVPAANPNTTCSNCCNFLGGNCSVVRGLIESYAWCRYWRAA